ncbi:MAG: KUP/HAK/KT family potassium transporter [Comamonadaceae bacterium]|nr:KUP/HAK/KT family potassium transporter [Comamonadaceae bacterium]
MFLTSTPDGVPHALLHNLKHNKVLHERVVFLTVVTRDIPFVADRRARRGRRTLGARLLADVRVLRLQGRPRRARSCSSSAAAARASPFDMMDTSFFVSPRDADPDRGARAWRCGASSCSRR